MLISSTQNICITLPASLAQLFNANHHRPVVFGGAGAGEQLQTASPERPHPRRRRHPPVQPPRSLLPMRALPLSSFEVQRDTSLMSNEL